MELVSIKYEVCYSHLFQTTIVIFKSVFRLTLLRWLVILMFALDCINPHATSHSFFQIISMSYNATRCVLE